MAAHLGSGLGVPHFHEMVERPGIRIQGSWFRVQSAGLREEGSEIRFRVEGLGLKIGRLGFGSLEFMV